MDANQLEDLIVRATSEPSARSNLVSALLGARVAIPIDTGLENGELPSDFKPLTLNAQEGYPVIAIFTTPAKAAPWIKQQPIFQHSLVTEFLWVLRITKPPFGIALNPGYKYSLALAPGEVEVLAAKAQAATQQLIRADPYQRGA